MNFRHFPCIYNESVSFLFLFFAFFSIFISMLLFFHFSFSPKTFGPFSEI